MSVFGPMPNSSSYSERVQRYQRREFLAEERRKAASDMWSLGVHARHGDTAAAHRAAHGVVKATLMAASVAGDGLAWGTVITNLGMHDGDGVATGVHEPMVAINDDVITVYIRPRTSSRPLTQYELRMGDIPLDELVGAVTRFADRLVAIVEFGPGQEED